MATFFLIRDPDTERRAGTVRAVADRMAEFEGLEVDSRETGVLSLVWGTRPGIPLEVASEGPRHAFVMGDAIADAGSAERA